MGNPPDHSASQSRHLGLAILTVSDSRTPESDRSGDRIAELASAAGHDIVARRLEPDAIERIRAGLDGMLSEPGVRWIVMTGGTGPAPRDVTVEAIQPLFERELPGFGELFRMLSYRDIGSAAMLSRACAGVVAGRPVFLLPGSTAAVELAMERLILPQIGHVVDLAVGG
jgi:molybdenum cofactor biosynthesis protein B